MLRKHTRTGGFFLNLIINMLLNLKWSIPAWIFLGLHCAFGLSLWWFWGALALWILRIWAYMMVYRWASSAPPSPPQKNKNPYSRKNFDYTYN